MEKYYRISEEDLLDLLQCESEITALETFGVDNWEGYGEAMSEAHDMNKRLITQYQLIEE